MFYWCYQCYRISQATKPDGGQLTTPNQGLRVWIWNNATSHPFIKLLVATIKICLDGKILVEILPSYPFYIGDSHRFYGENSQNYRKKLKILLEKNFWISFYFNVYFRFCSKVWFVFFPFSLRYTPFRLRKDNKSFWCLIKLTSRWYTLFSHRSAHP